MRQDADESWNRSGVGIVQPADIRAFAPESYVKVVLYGRFEPEVPGSYSVTSTTEQPSFVDGGGAERCDEGACTTATEGTVTFAQTSDGDTLVQVTLEFENGTRRLSVQHAAVRCGRVYAFCG